MRKFYSKVIWIVFFSLSLFECGCSVKTNEDLSIQEKAAPVIELRLLKSKTMLDDSFIQLSEKPSQNHTVIDDSGTIIASWLPIYTAVDEKPLSPLDTNMINDLVHRKTDQGEIEILVEKDIYDISNEHIQKILINPFPKINTTNDFFIKLNQQGGELLAHMTNVIAEDNHDDSVQYYLCCILNSEILLMTKLDSPIQATDLWFSLYFRDEEERVKQEKELRSIRKKIGSL